MESLKDILIMRDNLTPNEAEKRISEARGTLSELLSEGEDFTNFMEEEFGLEPDYLFEFIG